MNLFIILFLSEKYLIYWFRKYREMMSPQPNKFFQKRNKALSPMKGFKDKIRSVSPTIRRSRKAMKRFPKLKVDITAPQREIMRQSEEL